MLEIVKQKIENLGDLRFDLFFHDYVMNVQDMNIQKELDYLISNNDLTPIKIHRLVNQDMERLVKSIDRRNGCKK